jgi:hypothetical protein
MTLLFKRIVHHMGAGLKEYEPREMLAYMFGTTYSVPGIDYIISRTTRRPREILQFVRLSHQHAVDQDASNIHSDAILRAEEEFSTWKLEHVCAEYLHIYPDLESLLRRFRGAPSNIAKEEIETIIPQAKERELAHQEWINVSIDNVIQILFQVEFLGIRRANKSAHPYVSWLNLNFSMNHFRRM